MLSFEMHIRDLCLISVVLSLPLLFPSYLSILLSLQSTVLRSLVLQRVLLMQFVLN